MRNGVLAAVVFFGAALGSGCKSQTVVGEAIDGPYYLSASILSPGGGKGICYLRRSGACDPRVPPSVVSIGRNSDFISAAIRSAGDPSALYYYYIVRDFDGPNADLARTVRGPYDEAAFNEERRKHGVPAVAIIIDA